MDAAGLFFLAGGAFGRGWRGIQGTIAMQTTQHVRAGGEVTGSAVGLRQRNGGKSWQHFWLNMFIGGQHESFRANLFRPTCVNIGQL